MRRNRTLSPAVACVLVGLVGLSGCGHEVVKSTGPRSPTSADQVKLYPKYPSKYEELGLVSVEITPGLGWDDRGHANTAFDKLKEKAAALGANGLLLEVPLEKYQFNATAGYKGTFYKVPMRSRPDTALGEAIFVLKE